MAKFYFRSVATQTLIDDRTYRVEADTSAAAHDLLAEAQETAQTEDEFVIHPAIKEVHTRHAGGLPVEWIEHGDEVRQLDPTEISDGEHWLVQVDPETGLDMPDAEPAGQVIAAVKAMDARIWRTVVAALHCWIGEGQADATGAHTLTEAEILALCAELEKD